MEEILTKVRSRRSQVAAYIRKQEPRNRLLLNMAVLCGIAGTTLAGIPAIGGTSAINGIKSVTETRLPIWQILCIGAALCTMLATIATTWRNNHDTANKLARAQVIEAKMEVLELSLESGQIDLKQALDRYSEYNADIVFIPKV